MNNNQKINKIEPVLYNLINFIDEDKIISYTDCFEISLLRFLHGVFVSNNSGKLVFDSERMKTFMLDTPECNQLIDFFSLHSKIEPGEEYYQDKKSDGYQLRTDWCVFLNKKSFFRYKKDNKYELCACLNNLYAFFKVFLPKIYLDQPLDKIKVRKLASKLSSSDKNIKMNITSKITKATSSYYYSNNIKICINNIWYNWNLYQYFENDNGTWGERITGHSELTFV